MREVYTADQIRAAEAATGNELTSGRLMQQAAAALAAVVAEELGEGPGSVLVVVGPGNNGGDALYAGARLAAAGHRVVAWRALDRTHAGGWQAYLEAGGTETDGGGALGLAAEVDVVVDGVYGIGARLGLPPAVATLARACRDARVTVVSCDIPSGLEADRAVVGDASFTATRTVTFGGYKACQVLEPARSRCGRVTLVEIGLDLPTPPIVAWDEEDVAARWPYPDQTSDKYSRGVLGIDTGSDSYPGAGVLATLGAVYAGAGMVRYQGSDEVARLVRMLTPNVVAAEGRVQAWLVGSGWGARRDAPRRMTEALASGVPVVVDADALRQLPDGVGRPEILMTPHAGELSRLVGCDRREIESDPLASVRAAVDRFGVTVLLKGASQYVATPDSDQVWVAVPGPAWTAQAGSGDVLAGICGTLVAAGLSAREAALCGASVQALTARRNPGPYPPQDIARRLPETVAWLESLRR